LGGGACLGLDGGRGRDDQPDGVGPGRAVGGAGAEHLEVEGVHEGAHAVVAAAAEQGRAARYEAAARAVTMPQHVQRQGGCASLAWTDLRMLLCEVGGVEGVREGGRAVAAAALQVCVALADGILARSG
jgi:hypothetical protein